MSIRLMAEVWQRRFDHGQQAVLLAMADHANDSGESCYPSIPLIAWKTGYSERQVTRILQGLTSIGVLEIVVPATGRKATEYAIHLDQAPRKRDLAAARDDTVSPHSKPRDDMVSPVRGDISSARGDISSARGDISSARGDIAMSPEPSVNHQREPSGNREGTRGAPSTPSSLPQPVQIFLDNGGTFPSGKLADGTPKRDRAIQFIAEHVRDDPDSLGLWGRVVAGYCAQWSSKSYTVMVNDYYCEGRVPGQPPARAAPHTNGIEGLSPGHQALANLRAKRLAAEAAQEGEQAGKDTVSYGNQKRD